MAKSKKKTKKKSNCIATVGRRKTSVARVRFYKKKGDIVVNGQSLEAYFPLKIDQVNLKAPLTATNTDKKYSATVKVEGGGKKGQVDAIVHGLARALDELDAEKYHDTLKENDFLTRDPRMRERRKPGTGGKARRQKQSPKR